MRGVAPVAAAVMLATLAACSSGGGEPNGMDIGDALALMAKPTIGDSPKAMADFKAEMGEVKVAKCERASQGGYRCTWTTATGGGTGRLVKDGERWKLVALGEG